MQLAIYNQVFLRALGTKNIYSASTVDQMPKQVAVGLMFGTVLSTPVPDLDNTDYLMVLGADPLRDRRRVVAAAVITGFFLCRMPWWGISWLNHPEWPRWIGRVLQNADTFGSLMALGLLWWALHLPEPWSTPGEDGADAEPAAYPTPLQQPLLAKEN